MRISGCFSADYVEARGKFREAAVAAGAALATHRNPAVTATGVQLSTEVAWLGPDRPARLLIVMSGTHGVEGFCGSGVQVGLLRSGLALERPADMALLFIHAISPSGFAAIRRVTDDNIDLNRNFVDHSQPYPPNPGYEELRDALCPEDWTPEGRRSADAVLEAYIKAHGFMGFQTAISAGQYVDPQGLFFGGHAPAWSNLTFRNIINTRARNVPHVAFMDLHSGLGPYGVGEIINNHVAGHPGYQRVKDWFGDEATSEEEGSSVSAQLRGTSNFALDEALTPQVITAIALEYGTIPPLDLLEALRAENWLYRRGNPDSKQGREIKAQLRAAFYADTDDWKTMVWERADDVFRRTIAGMARLEVRKKGRAAAPGSRAGMASLQRPVEQFMRLHERPKETQQQLFDSIMRRNAGTVFGKEHGFRNIKSVADYQRQVPIRSWAEMIPYVDQVIEGRLDTLTKEEPYFFQRTTGTTGKPKMIPFTRRCQTTSSLTHKIWIYKHLLDNPNLLQGKIMAILNAGVDGYTDRHVPFGSVSGNIFFRMPKEIRRAYSHPYDIYHVMDVQARRYSLLRFAVEQDCSFVFTGNPSSMLGIFEFGERHAEKLIRDIHDGVLANEFQIPDALRAYALNALFPNPKRARQLSRALEKNNRLRPIDYWPDLQALGCWIGGSMGHFAHLLREWCGDDFKYRDVGYMASEGVFSVPLTMDNPDGYLTLHAIFFEFVPEREFGKPDARALLAHELEPRQNYHVVITTTGGLYRYAMNDVIRVSEMRNGTPLLRFLYKGSNVQNIQGEMVTVDHVMSAMSALSTEFGLKFQHFQLVAELDDRRYALHIEPAGNLPQPALTRLLPSFERELGNVNENYAMFRADKLIGPPKLHVMQRGWFDRMSHEHMARTGRDSQFKPAVLSSKVEHPEMVEISLDLD
jgi:hypothetical protein